MILPQRALGRATDSTFAAVPLAVGLQSIDNDSGNSAESPHMDLARNLKSETVSRLYPTQAYLVQPTQPIADAVKLMRDKKVGCVLVCEQRRIVGIFTERDLLLRVLSPGLPLETPIQECMTPDPITVHPKDSISSAIKRMQKGGYRHLPVVIDERPVGILSVKRIVHYLVEHFPTKVYNLPPRPQPIQPQREGA